MAEDTPETKIKVLYQQIADLTRAACDPCIKAGRYTCCSPEYGLMALEIAAEHGVTLPESTGHPKCQFLGPTGCLVEPYLRPLCSLHICDKLLFGNIKFNEEYFKIRGKIEETYACIHAEEDALDVPE